ncbi:MutS protein 1, partial [Dipsacomyces acuminosporus]
ARELIRERLDGIGDVERAVNKLSLNCGGPHDLLDIAHTLREVTKIKNILSSFLDGAEAKSSATLADSGTSKDSSLSHPTRQRRRLISHRPQSALLEIARRKERTLQSLTHLMEDIQQKIRDDAERDVRIFGFLKPDCVEQITKLHEKLQQKEAERKRLQEIWQTCYKCPSLRLDTIPALGHFIEVSKRDSERLLESPEFRMIQSLRNKVRFENSEWTYLLSEIDMLRSLIQAEEMRVFEELRDEVLEAGAMIRTNCNVLADIDVAISMATLANLHQYTRPRFVSSLDDKDDSDASDPHVVVNGRHPVVETQLLAANRQYVGNDCVFSSKDSQVLLLTGPNMGGKSTYLRQIALTSILAQTGSFVPADDAQLHVVDAIYSRIGAHDNVALDQSTFMVEMAETAHILKHATSRSLVILDEIGRGTSTTDGIAIAYATL